MQATTSNKKPRTSKTSKQQQATNYANTTKYANNDRHTTNNLEDLHATMNKGTNHKQQPQTCKQN